jgi:hypothetical protein
MLVRYGSAPGNCVPDAVHGERTGSSVDRIGAFVASLDGSCRDRDGRLWCEIPVRTRFCAASMLGIEIVARDGLIEALSVEAGGISC